MITLSDGVTPLELQKDLYWADEYEWNPVEQSVVRSVTGAIIVSCQARIEGRPITLRPIDQSSAWMTKKTLKQLRHWAAVPGKQMVLTLQDETFNVIFRHQDSSGTSAEPIVFYNRETEEDTDFYLITLRLMTVEI